MVDIRDELADELDQTQDLAFEKTALIQPTKDELKNGWTAETLTQYVAERNAGAELRTDPHSLHRRMKQRPRVQNIQYNPHRWR